MKTKLLLLSCSLFIALAVKAQKPDVAQIMVHYKFSHLRDTTKHDSLYKENMVLFVGQNASAYKSYDRKLQDQLVKKQVQEQIAAATASGGPMKINIRSRGNITNTEYYQFASEKKLIRKEKLINSYLIEEPIPAISWKISADTATLQGLHCQKATTHFLGRDYTAWFCPDLPYHTGPWKLNGLPGLIVEAADAKKEVIFKFDGIEEVSKLPKPDAAAAAPAADHAMTVTTPGGGMVKMIGMDDGDTDPSVIALPTDGLKTSEKEFKNLQEAMRKDPQAFMQSAMAGSGMNFRQGGDGPGGPAGGNHMNFKVGTGPVINNPIELPEKR